MNPIEESGFDDSTDGRVRRARALREDRREQLLNAALEVFAKCGYRETSIEELLKAAGVARGTFYQHFKGKRDVFDALLDAFLGQLQRAIVRVDVQSEIEVGVQLLGNVRRIIDLLYDNNELARLFLHQAVGLDRGFDEKLREFDDRVLEMLQGSLKTGEALGLVRPGPVRLRSVFVLGTMKEAVAEAVLLQETPTIGREEAETVRARSRCAGQSAPADHCAAARRTRQSRR